MVPTLFFYELVWLGLLWLCLILFDVLSPCDRAATGQPTSKPAKATQKRSKEPKPFPGLTQKPRLGGVRARGRGSPPTPPAPAPPPHLHTRTSAHDRHAASFLSRPGLFLLRLGGAQQPPFQRSSWRQPVAATPVCSLPRIFSGKPWHPGSWQACIARDACVGSRDVSRRLGHPGRGPHV